jgi:hypothetical protein
MARRLSLPLLLVLCLVIGSPLLGAQSGTRKEIQRAPHRTQTAPVGDRLSQLWQHLTALWGAEGCGLDPDGARCAKTTTSTGSVVVQQPSPEGCILDPNGCR